MPVELATAGVRLARNERIAVRKTIKKLDGDPCHMLEVEHVESGEIVLRCMIGDDEGVERIADFLSAKHYQHAAEKVRQIIRDGRRRA
jgi:hypothetical protein